MKGGYTYMLTNKNHTMLYIGVTSDLYGRMTKHRGKAYPRSFTARYNVNKLVYYEVFDSMLKAIDREKQLKAGSREQKIKLICEFNPQWRDLFDSIENTE